MGEKVPKKHENFFSIEMVLAICSFNCIMYMWFSGLELGLSDHLWTLAFSLIMITSILGNSIVLWIVLGKIKCIRNCLLAFITRSDNKQTTAFYADNFFVFH